MPHASFDTLEYALVTMFALYLGEELDPVRQVCREADDGA